ncbi:iron donor protein CyaY [Nitrogeniibacter mangrovi]|uniref:Iron-sulfur cluster assembly protein CyaY n=1 Tax=Nitrogeniibacter mangrovi TaxID=2016596 RepID=A0A6C1B3K6_9RHOO|nr:iron donor protein CyaY [Nitrogeniibacter mangrovi]QID16784.1 iron donor protein CyaY [Nitrogeniibacter mangrovi]
MDESVFVNVAEKELTHIEEALEACGAEIDIEPQPGGILALTFEDDSQIIINRHVAAREIWVAARSGGFHFRPENGAWINTRGGEELYALLSRVVSEQAGEAVTLTPA